MPLDAAHLRDLIVRPALERLGLWSLAAEQLVIGTAAQESGLRNLRQLGRGPALGLWQCEPATHDDLYANFLKYKPELERKLRTLLAPEPDPERQLCSNLLYGAAICRIHYFRDRRPLPLAGDVVGFANTWKRWYNTERGAGKPEEFISAWHRLVARSYQKEPMIS